MSTAKIRLFERLFFNKNYIFKYYILTSTRRRNNNREFSIIFDLPKDLRSFQSNLKIKSFEFWEGKNKSIKFREISIKYK